ncbi:MAG: phasin family protein [Dokdonella sp.]|nr:phasin family protein [Dokdonella sp.]
MRKNASRDDSATAIPSADQNGHAQPVTDPFSRMGGVMLAGIAQERSELLRFIGSRLVRIADALGRLAKCATPMEVMQLQLQIGSDTAADCLAEAQRLIGVMEKAAGGNLALLP